MVDHPPRRRPFEGGDAAHRIVRGFAVARERAPDAKLDRIERGPAEFGIVIAKYVGNAMRAVKHGLRTGQVTVDGGKQPFGRRAREFAICVAARLVDGCAVAFQRREQFVQEETRIGGRFAPRVRARLRERVARGGRNARFAA